MVNLGVTLITRISFSVKTLTVRRLGLVLLLVQLHACIMSLFSSFSGKIEITNIEKK